MKRTIHALLTIPLWLLLLVSCQADVVRGLSDNDNILTLSISQTRTSLGDKSAGTYPVYWSEGDCIVANGKCSGEAQIDAEDRSRAQFEFDESLTYPLTITYPYTSSSTTQENRVVFPAEQSYLEGTFSQGSTPMCGYAASKGIGIELKHLAAILRFSVKASTEGTVLDKIVVTSSGAKLSGEFVVDCKRGTISPTNQTSSCVTYTLPDRFNLSTSTESIFYVALPAGDVGACTIEFVEESGEKMTKFWTPSSTVKAGVVREFSTIVYEQGVVGSLPSFDVYEDTLLLDREVYGRVKDTNGNPIKGVAVSDGFTVVTTDEDGYYKMMASSDAWYIYISLPAEYEVPLNEYEQPCFFKAYSIDQIRYDFTLKPLAGGKEKKFALFSFADPQVSNSTGLDRFKNTAVPNTKKYVTTVSAQMPCYGITLGDIISNSMTNNDEQYRDDMRDGFAVSKIGMPVFHVMGNHDGNYSNESNLHIPDSRSSTYNLKAQRNYETLFGPVNYSFNRGDVHIIGMRDIVYTGNSSLANSPGFLQSQVEWLRQDLALVPKDKMVVLCVHIQLLNRTTNYIQDVLRLLDEYTNVHILSGHTHIQRNYIHKFEGTSYTNIYEHNTCAFCGAWWSAKIAGDGCPNGYNVWVVDGNNFVDWYYMGYCPGADSRSHQMRLYRGNAITGGEISGDNGYGVKGYYRFNYADNVILANIYNADNNWTVSVYENGVYSGDMQLITKSSPSFDSLVGDYTLANPRHAPNNTVPSTDYYVVGLHVGILGRYGADGLSSGAGGTCYHMYKYTLKNKNATVKVVAKDGFGNVYEESNFTDYNTYTKAPLNYRW